MSILISGMEMPTDCSRWVVIYPDGKVEYSDKTDEWETLDKGAAPVPPHGRLIDADALIANHFSDEHRIALSYANKCWMRRIINGEPTIIPEEERET